MNRLNITEQSQAQQKLDGLYKEFSNRTSTNPQGLCPVETALAFTQLCLSQSCGKCVPCRVGLARLCDLLKSVVENEATEQTLELIERTANVISDSADCAIGYEAGALVAQFIVAFKDDFIEHITNNRCLYSFEAPVPCKTLCPAHVDIPGYIALVKDHRYADAVKLIRKDNPLPTVCALVCEHPCEEKCRRGLIDSSVNIRAIKRVAVDNAGVVTPPNCAEPTGKKIAIIGGGPSGLTASYFLNLMGHTTEIYEQRNALGGMLRYGIPAYRLPREELDKDINAILATGTTVHTNVSIGKDISFEEIRNSHDATYIAIGAHTDKALGIEGENADGVISAVEMLRDLGDGIKPDFANKNVVVVGGGNVAMDCTRSAVRLGANTTCVYRRRKEDMTALAEEVEGAIAEGAVILTLNAPTRVETNNLGKVTGLWVKPQMISVMDKSGRPSPVNANSEEVLLPADVIVVAIGQDIDSKSFEKAGIPINRNRFVTGKGCEIKGFDNVFSGGDCASGPLSAIKAIAAGKTAAANIDTFLGFNHPISVDIDIPQAKIENKPACGRSNQSEREPMERNHDFEQFEFALSNQESDQECSRCLRCDKFGFGALRGGREEQW